MIVKDYEKVTQSNILLIILSCIKLKSIILYIIYIERKRHWAIYMIDMDSLSQVFGHIKLHKKKSSNIYIFFYLRKSSRLRGKFCSTALVT